MASKWLWNSINLWVSEQDLEREIKRAELFVLDATTSVWHYFGAGSRKYPTKGFVIGDTDRASLESDATGNTARTLTTPYGNIASLKINSIKFSLHKYAGGTIDGVSYSSETTPIWDYEMELIADA